MRSLVNIFTKQYGDNSASRIQTLSFNNVKYRYAESVYNLLIRMREVGRIIENGTKSITYSDLNKNTFNEIYMSILNNFRDLVRCEDKEELDKIYHNIYTNDLMRLSGFISSANQRMDISPGNPTVYSYKEEEANQLISKLISYLDLRPEENVLCMMGVTNNYSNNFVNSMMKHIILSHDETNRDNVRADYYVYLDRQYEEINNNSDMIDKCKKIIVGSTSEVRISNNFDITIVGSTQYNYYFHDYSSYSEDEDLETRLLWANTHTAIGGLEIILMPHVFMNAHMIDFISGYLDNINIYFDDTDKLVAIVGNRKPKITHNYLSEMDIMYRLIFEQSSDKNCTSKSIPSMKPLIFRSCSPSEEDINRIIENNKTFLDKINSNVLKELTIKTEEEMRHPLLPFSPGQLGLVLVSGKIDGIVDEGGGVYHVIKGTTYRTNTQASTVDADGNVTNQTTYGTGTSVTMLTADGSYKTLR